MSLTGRIHSIESCGTVDGPGIRFVIFLQGCPLRCQYCHNPDTWKLADGKLMDVDTVMQEVVKYKSYMRFTGGGITITGGEPLVQADFVLELLKACKAEGINTAIDTSGYLFNDKIKEILDYTDLVLLDIKHYDALMYKTITGVDLQPTLNFMDYLGQINKDVWIRYVLVPGLSDQVESITALSKYLGQFKNIKKIELLPFHKMGEYKWEELGIKYQLTDVSEPSKEDVIMAMGILKMHNMHVVTT
jgi:pyruvate formate lyase activating enzyme